MRIAWKLLIAAGAILIVIALGYDTTVQSGIGRIHNIGLQNERQMLLILGCFLMLAGVILFAVAKLKQTPEEDRRDLEERQAAEAKAAEKLRKARANVAAAEGAAARVLSPMRPKWDKWGIRLTAGALISCYWWLMLLMGTSGGQWATLGFFAALYACFVMRDVRRGIGAVLLATSALAALVLLKLMATATSTWDEMFDAETVVRLLMVFVVPGVAALATGLYLLNGRKAALPPDSPPVKSPDPRTGFGQVDLQGNISDITRRPRAGDK